VGTNEMASDTQGKIVELKATRQVTATQSLLESTSDAAECGLSVKVGNGEVERARLLLRVQGPRQVARIGGWDVDVDDAPVARQHRGRCLACLDQLNRASLKHSLMYFAAIHGVGGMVAASRYRKNMCCRI
jgi:hypothetical protein